MNLNMTVVSAFAEHVFAGNPAAVMVLAAWLPDELMQSIAMQNNLSETAFVVRQDDGDYAIRWFSPLAEIDFCGHATLASAWVLFEAHPELTQLQFFAKAVGRVPVTRLPDGRFELSFPIRAPEVLDDAAVAASLAAGLGCAPSAVLQNQQAYVVRLDSEAQVRALRPDFAILKTLGPRDVVVTAQGEDCDFVSRYFWPANGGEEDPVTGSIHAGLAPYWGKALGKTELLAKQVSARVGVLYCTLTDERVLVSGHGVLYARSVVSA